MATTPDETPALKPPAGVTPNFINPESLSKWNVLCVSMCLAFTTVVFVMRAYVRIGIKRQWILEDWMCLISWTGLVTYCALMTTTMHKHGGVHQWDLTTSEVHQAIYWFNVTSIEYAPIILCTKLAILLLYRRVFVPSKRSALDWAIRVFMAILILFYIATTFVKIWECTPRAKIWNKSIPGKCINVSSLLNTSGLFNTITDIIILLIPVKAVWALQMSRSRKVAIVLVFTVGLLAPVFSMIGFIVRIKISSSPDVTYNQPEILLWAAAEVSMGLICVCVPALAPLLHRRRPSGPSHSILNGEPNSRRMYYAGTKRHSISLEEKDLFDPVDLGQPYGLTAPPPAVVTGIAGGVDSRDRGDGGIEMKDIASAESREEIERSHAILTTVRMEHSYV